ncbi:MAG: sensor histidine kinase [Pseudonocardiaceae bacterium]
MKISGLIENIHIPPSAKRDAIFLPAIFLFNCFSFSSWMQLGQLGTRPWLLLVWLYGLVALLPLAWRGKAPLTVFVIQCLFTVVAWPILPLYTPIAGIPVALYAVSTHYRKTISLLTLLASFIPNGLAAAVAFVVYPNDFGAQIRSFIQNGVFLVLVAGGAWALGRATQASKQRVQDLEHEKRTVQDAVVEERRRIARELHDIVSHAVTVMTLQAAGAARVATTDFEEVVQALANIESKGTQAMVELQRLLGVLRGDDLTDQATGVNGLRPQPVLANLPALLDSLPAIGSRVTHHVEGTSCELDPSVDLAAYRIVQEGLTNVLRHAGERANPQLRLVWHAPTLLIQIDNGINLAKAHSRQTTSGGRGLVGLRERVHAVGGQLEAGPRRGAGYRLTAILPLATHPRVPAIAVPRAPGQDHGD